MSFSGRRISILRPGDVRPLGDVTEGDGVKGASTKKELSPNGNTFPCLMTLFETLFIPSPTTAQSVRLSPARAPRPSL
jgi:hypothetical protein